MSSAAQKAAARRKLKEDRIRGVSRTEDYEVPEEEAVYDVIDEEEYQNLVEERRERDDFVVDDDGLGYYDDGEEHAFDGDMDADATSKKKRIRTGAHATLAANADALKKARKTNNLLKQQEPKSSGSMWNFVKRGAAAMDQTNKKESSNASRLDASTLDSLLAGLDHQPIRSSRPTGSRSRMSAPLSRYRPEYSVTSRKLTPASRHTEESDDDDRASTFHFDNVSEEDPIETFPESVPSEDIKMIETPEKAEDTKTLTIEAKADQTQFNEEKPTVPVAKRIAFAKPKLNRIVQKETESIKPATALASVPTLNVTTQPDPMSANTEETNFSNVDAKLETVLQRNEEAKEEEKKSFVDLYYVDTWEKNGLIYLFGKVAVQETYVSACVVVHNNVRNLFVLPKNSDTSMLDIHQEIGKVLKPSCIPNREGASFAAKPVVRKYAFEDSSVPRGDTKYLKVKYDAKYPAPSLEVCMKGGEHFAKIFNGGASPLETFIIKRKLQGPSWLRIYNPSSNPQPVSWCKLEMKVASPKDICRMELLKSADGSAPLFSSAQLAPPPVKSVSIKLKTIVNPKTNKSEIVSVTAVCNSNINLDSATDISDTRHTVQLSLIRPLGVSAGEGKALQKFPHDLDQEIVKTMPQLQKMVNERALLSRLLTQIGNWDPDVIVGHNIWGYDMDLILSRCVELCVAQWSKMGRRRVTSMPKGERFGRSKDWAIAEAMVGRILADTYLFSKEHLRETTYSLKHLASTQLKIHREDVEPVDIPPLFNSSKTIVQLAQHTLLDSQIVMKLMLKLQLLPLSKQLTCISGSLWSRSVKGNRAERNEYLLLHEFHSLKYICPEKSRPPVGGKRESSGRAAAKYSGGLVFEPKKGLYDTMILLLDFNSLYPSIIQEFNLCFTTLDWSNYVGVEPVAKRIKGDGDDNDDEEVVDSSSSAELPPVPNETVESGVLPRVIRQLVERRGIVKKLMKKEINIDKKEELDIRQKALKLTANSMYGCLGFSHSRFYAQPIAALITALGRETLQKTRDLAEDKVNLEVIYGDTDSIMINTGISDLKNFDEVMRLGGNVKREVNRLYKTLELEIDGVFKSMLLLKKKKYAAVKIERNAAGEFVFEKEMKGLDLVRRDWCVQSKDTGRFVLDQILSGDQVEVVVNNIHSHLEELALKMRNGDWPLEKFTITKGLSKHPNEYPDGKSQPHVQVAKSMLAHNRPVNVGDHIPYIICKIDEEEMDGGTTSKKQSFAERARHPEEILRSNGVLKPDIEWYLTQQILPPITRLCEPIASTSQAIIAEKLGLDSAKYNQIRHNSGGSDPFDGDGLLEYKPASSLSDSERFKDVEKVELTCLSCGQKNAFAGAIVVVHNRVDSGLRCPNPTCLGPYLWGHNSHSALFAKACSIVNCSLHRHLRGYYAGVMVCDDSGCRQETRQLSVLGDMCLKRGCTGKLISKYSDHKLFTQLKYFDSLFDVDHALKNIVKDENNNFSSKKALIKDLLPADKEILAHLHNMTQTNLALNAYNWVEPSIWQTLFGKSNNSSSIATQ